jgi:hypothetical protein
MYIAELVQGVYVVLTQLEGKGSVAGNEGLLFLRASISKVGGATRGGRVPFCASAILSIKMSRAR